MAASETELQQTGRLEGKHAPQLRHINTQFLNVCDVRKVGPGSKARTGTGRSCCP